MLRAAAAAAAEAAEAPLRPPPDVQRDYVRDLGLLPPPLPLVEETEGIHSLYLCVYMMDMVSE